MSISVLIHSLALIYFLGNITEKTQKYARVRNSLRKYAKVFVLAHDTLPSKNTHFYNVLLKCFKGVRNFEVYENRQKTVTLGEHKNQNCQCVHGFQ